MSADSVLDALLDGLVAQVDAIKAQLAAIRQRLETAHPPRVRQALPERCHPVPARFCALRNEEVMDDRSGFGVSAWECRACGHREEIGAGEASGADVN